MIAAIVQARMGSQRLPGKSLSRIAGMPMLGQVAARLKACRALDKIIIATSVNKADDPIAEFCRSRNLLLLRGSNEDVLDRYYQAARVFGADIIVRVTADCPLIDPRVVDRVIREYRRSKVDYAANSLIYTYPDGMDVEVFSFRALRKAHQEAKARAEREHVTPYIRNSGLFRIKNVVNPGALPPGDYKWSVDNQDDLDFVRQVYARLYRKGRIFHMEEVLKLLRDNPRVKELNRGSVVNEGYYKSLVYEPGIAPRKKRIEKSLHLKEKALKFIPGCSQTFSKGPDQFVQGLAPVFLERGQGCRVWDVDGNSYLDFCMALAPVILGYNYPAVNAAVKKSLQLGTVFTLSHRLEVELSELLTEIIPCAQMVRFGKNGSDVTAAAVRISRAYTSREKIACCGYHGWQDWYIGSTSRNKGVPRAVRELTLTFKYNDIGSLEKLFRQHKNQIAAVIMEPVGVVEPKAGFLSEVKALAHKNKALLIFDEVITGFRLSLGGAQKYFGVVPDLACFGKAMANGFPISAIVGRREIMQLFEEAFFSFTFGGDICAIAAALATIKEIKAKGVIPHLWEQGRKIRDGYNVLAKEYALDEFTQCVGLAPRTVINFKDKKGNDDLALKSLFQQECIRRGLLFTASHNICLTHTNKDVDYALRVYRTVLEIIKDALGKHKVRAMLTGKPVQPVFRKA
jgi:glutamate-1-semialdehyde 2,1-aminomutase/spore coat polysaccharide biosynthesis protein SpsF